MTPGTISELCSTVDLCRCILYSCGVAWLDGTTQCLGDEKQREIEREAKTSIILGKQLFTTPAPIERRRIVATERYFQRGGEVFL